MTDRLDDTLARAIEAGLLPATAVRPAAEARPWPVVLLTALGAWLAAVPLLIVVGMLLGDLITRSVGPYLVGLLILAGAVVVLRSRELPLFVEQLAVPALLVGGGCLAFGVFRDLPDRAGAVLLALVAMGLALAVGQVWLRVLLGALMAGLVGFALLGSDFNYFRHRELDLAWLSCHALLLIWAAALWLQGRLRELAAALESLAAGWLLVVLAGLAWLAGMTFLVGGALGGSFVGEVAREVAGGATRGGLWQGGLPLVSALLALAAVLLAARAWPLLRRPAWWLPGALVALVAMGLSALLLTLGGVLLALALTATTQRWRLAAAAGVAAAWVIGSFYYQLAWPLTTKAAVLVGAGVVLGALAWWLMRSASTLRSDPPSDAPTAPRLDVAARWLAAGTVLTLLVAVGAIWQKQSLIANGQKVFVELAPVDPRSLMQGDYMALNFRTPGSTWSSWGSWDRTRPGLWAARPHVVATRDARGVATLLRQAAQGGTLADGEFLIELSPKQGDWVLVTDAWFFPEGEGARWAKARYGEFRVAADGRALLVGMADAELKPILP